MFLRITGWIVYALYSLTLFRLVQDPRTSPELAFLGALMIPLGSIVVTALVLYTGYAASIVIESVGRVRIPNLSLRLKKASLL